jgi:hypothetical protein
MKAKFIKKIQSYEKLFNVMEKNLNKWSNIDHFKSNYDDFVLNLKKLKDLLSITEKDLSATKSSLKSLRNDIETKLVPVTNLLDLYAGDKNKKTLKKKIDNARGKLSTMSPEGLNKYVVEITNFAEKKFNKVDEGGQKSNKLQGYGLSMKLIDELKTDNENYADLRASLKAEKKAVKEAIKEISKRIKENEKIIKSRFKKFMTVFMNTDPAFYEAYLNALKSDSEEVIEKPKPENKITTQTEKASTPAGKTAVRKTPAGNTKRKAPVKTKASTVSKVNQPGQNKDT